MKLAIAVKKAIKDLNNMYFNNLISYPRVDNDFIIQKGFDFFPHPPFTAYNNAMSPLEEKLTYSLNKTTALLFLSIMRIATPSLAISLAETIDEFFDDDLDFLDNDRKEEVLRLLTAYKQFILKEGISEAEILEYSRNIFEQNQKNGIKVIGNKIKTPFFVNSTSKKRLELNRYLFLFPTSSKKKKKKDEEDSLPFFFETLGESIDAYKSNFFDFKIKNLISLEEELKAFDKKRVLDKINKTNQEIAKKISEIRDNI